MKYGLSSIADELCILFGYLFLLGREPENETVLKNAAKSNRTVQQLRSDIIRSTEMEGILKKWMIEMYIRGKYDDGFDVNIEQLTRTKDIILIQTSDDLRYRQLLDCSSKYNAIFSDRHELEYRSFIGIKRGAHPHHAMFNRIHILDELVDQNFGGWVLYIDADAIVTDPHFPLKEYLHNLRLSRKVMALHPVRSLDAPNYNWWSVNDGCFAIDLSAGRARLLIKTWAGIYKDLYSMKEFNKAKKWDSIMDDQSSLWLILRIFEMKDHINLTQLQGKDGFVRQILRQGNNTISSEEEILARCQSLAEIGQKIYNFS